MMAMHLMSLFVVLLYNGVALVEGIVVTKYDIVSPSTNNTMAYMHCGNTYTDFEHCAIKVGNNTCEPVPRSWCVTKTTEDDDVYLVKKTVTERFENTSVETYSRPMPIVLYEGSEIEMGFVLRPDWKKFQIDLMNDVKKALEITMTQNNNVYLASSVNKNEEWGYNPTPRRFNFKSDEAMLLKIAVGKNAFNIDLNGTRYDHRYKLGAPVSGVTRLESEFSGVPGDLLYVTFKAGK